MTTFSFTFIFLGVDAEVNVELFHALVDGQSFIKQENCAAAAKAVEAINAHLKVPLMQSLIYFSHSTIAMHSDDDAAGYVATLAAFPILNDIDPASAETIKSAMDFTTPSTTRPAGKEAMVYSALSDVFSNPKTPGIVDCELVTNFDEICHPDKDDVGDNVDPSTPEDENGNVVSGPVEPEKPMPISNGLYIATNYVGDRSAIALDVQEIKDSLEADDADRARDYYNKGEFNNYSLSPPPSFLAFSFSYTRLSFPLSTQSCVGENSKIFDENGMDTGKRRSISRFSTESKSTMKGDPTYNLFIHGLSDRNQEFLGKPAIVYADSFISDLLYAESPAAPDAMVAVTIWMQVAHSLHSAYGACKSSFLTDGRTINGRHLQNSDPALLIDEAAAYWIGDNQATGSSSKGHLLYALTERIGGKFEKIPEGAESYINTRIIDLFNKVSVASHVICLGCNISCT